MLSAHKRVGIIAEIPQVLGAWVTRGWLPTPGWEEEEEEEESCLLKVLTRSLTLQPQGAEAGNVAD